jgi:MFS family permease
VSDRRLLYAAAFLRAIATAMMAVLLGVHLAQRGLDVASLGIVVAAGLAGAATASLVVTLAGDGIGRRRALVLLTVLAAGGAVAAGLADEPVAIAIAAFVGMLNGMGRDRGAALILEQAALPATTTDAERTTVFARYNVLQDVGHAVGSLLAALPALSHRPFTVYVLILAAAVPLYLRLSPRVEGAARARQRLSPESRPIVAKLCALFALDSLGGGFLTTALIALFFHQRFGVGEGGLGMLFFAARAANAVSHLVAARLAARFGLVNTMVFTHIPSSLLLATVPFAPTFPIAAALFLLREGLVEMDVPTRQSYVMAVVRPEERTVASGATHLVRMAAWAVAPAFAGLFAARGNAAAPFVIGAAMKITYDILLYAAFRRLRPPEETPATSRP